MVDSKFEFYLATSNCLQGFILEELIFPVTVDPSRSPLIFKNFWNLTNQRSNSHIFHIFFRAAWHALKSTPNFPTFTAPTTNTFSENVVNHTDITASLGGSIPLIKRLQNLAEFARNCTLFLRKSSCDMKLSSVVIHAPAYCKYNFTPFYSTLIDDCWALKEIFKWNIKIVSGIYHDRSSSSAATIDNWNF